MSSWRCFLSLHPSWRHRKGIRKRRTRKGARRGNRLRPLLQEIGGGILIERNSGPRLESGKAKDNKESFGRASSAVESGGSDIVSFAASGNGAERVDAFGKEFWKAVDGENFVWLSENLESWRGA